MAAQSRLRDETLAAHNQNSEGDPTGPRGKPWRCLVASVATQDLAPFR
jgi:hypothetical protein